MPLLQVSYEHILDTVGLHSSGDGTTSLLLPMRQPPKLFREADKALPLRLMSQHLGSM